MQKVIINAFIDTESQTLDDARSAAMQRVNVKDTANDIMSGEDVVTKLYHIVPSIGKIIVAVSDDDMGKIGATQNIIAETDISGYPLEKLPAKIIEYKELIIKPDSTLTADDAINAAQAMAEHTANVVFPYKLPLVKVIDYRDDNPSKLVIPTIFGQNIFESVSGLTNDGDADKGKPLVGLGYCHIKYMRLKNIMKDPNKPHCMFGLAIEINGTLVMPEDTDWDEQGGNADHFDFHGEDYLLRFHECKVNAPLRNSVNSETPTTITFKKDFGEITGPGSIHIKELWGAYWVSNQTCPGFDIEFLDENMNPICSKSYRGLDNPSSYGGDDVHKSDSNHIAWIDNPNVQFTKEDFGKGW